MHLLGFWQRRRCVFHPTGFQAHPFRAAIAHKPILRWRKKRLGGRVAVVAGWGFTAHRLSIVPGASAALAFIKAPAEPRYRRSTPRIVGAPAALARIQAAHLAGGLVTPPPGGIALIEDATIAASGVVLTADGCVIEESLINSQDWGAFGMFLRPQPGAPLSMKVASLSFQKRLSACPHVMMKQTYDANYGHWLIECLPRLAAVAEHFDLAACKFIVSDKHGAMQKIYVDSLAACGIKPEQIVCVDYTPVHVDMLVYPLPMTTHPWVKSASVVTCLAGLLANLTTAAPGPKRIYVSRNKGRTRRLTNEDAVIRIVERLGFTVVYPETLSFAEQVVMFRNATIVVGNYGANLSNVVFAPQGVTLFALTTEFMQDDFFWDLIDHMGGLYVSLHGRAVGTTIDQNADFTIDVDRFASILDEVISAPGARETTAVAHRCDR